MAKAIFMNIKELKCDTEGCDYRNDSVTLENYHEWVGKPCPKCGRSLLTKEDYEAVQSLINITNFLNAFFPEVNEEEDELHQIKIKTNGTGKINVEEITIGENNKE